jgi:hypothetical protein
VAETLPALPDPAGLAELQRSCLVPALIADAGDAAGWRYVEFFAANIDNDNDNTRRAYRHIGGSQCERCSSFGTWNAARICLQVPLAQKPVRMAQTSQDNHRQRDLLCNAGKL